MAISRDGNGSFIGLGVVEDRVQRFEQFNLYFGTFGPYLIYIGERSTGIEENLTPSLLEVKYKNPLL